MPMYGTHLAQQSASSSLAGPLPSVQPSPLHVLPMGNPTSWNGPFPQPVMAQHYPTNPYDAAQEQRHRSTLLRISPTQSRYAPVFPSASPHTYSASAASNVRARGQASGRLKRPHSTVNRRATSACEPRHSQDPSPGNQTPETSRASQVWLPNASRSAPRPLTTPRGRTQRPASQQRRTPMSDSRVRRGSVRTSGATRPSYVEEYEAHDELLSHDVPWRRPSSSLGPDVGDVSRVSAGSDHPRARGKHARSQSTTGSVPPRSEPRDVQSIQPRPLSDDEEDGRVGEVAPRAASRHVRPDDSGSPAVKRKYMKRKRRPTEQADDEASVDKGVETCVGVTAEGAGVHSTTSSPAVRTKRPYNRRAPLPSKRGTDESSDATQQQTPIQSTKRRLPAANKTSKTPQRPRILNFAIIPLCANRPKYPEVHGYVSHRYRCNSSSSKNKASTTSRCHLSGSSLERFLNSYHGEVALDISDLDRNTPPWISTSVSDPIRAVRHGLLLNDDSELMKLDEKPPPSMHKYASLVRWQWFLREKRHGRRFSLANPWGIGAQRDRVRSGVAPLFLKRSLRGQQNL